MKNKIKNKSGFTLLELLVVVVIIGILAAIALPQYSLAVTKSKFAALKIITKSIAEAEQRYYLAYDTYTTQFEALDIDVKNIGSLSPEGDYLIFNPNSYCYISLKYGYNCYDKKINMAYQISLNGKILCQAYNNDTIAQKICQQETNNTPNGGNGNFWYYY